MRERGSHKEWARKSLALLKVGVFSGSASRSEERSLGFAETPPASPILEKIMVSLGDEILDE
jgi:hypothetical protein